MAGSLSSLCDPRLLTTIFFAQLSTPHIAAKINELNHITPSTRPSKDCVLYLTSPQHPRPCPLSSTHHHSPSPHAEPATRSPSCPNSRPRAHRSLNLEGHPLPHRLPLGIKLHSCFFKEAFLDHPAKADLHISTVTAIT